MDNGFKEIDKANKLANSIANEVVKDERIKDELKKLEIIDDFEFNDFERREVFDESKDKHIKDLEDEIKVLRTDLKQIKIGLELMALNIKGVK